MLIDSKPTTEQVDQALPANVPARIRRAMPVWLQAIVLIGVFVCGIGVGAVGASRYVLMQMQHYRTHPEQLPGKIAASLERRLRLSDSQAEQVLQVVEHRHERIEQARQSTAPAIHREFDLMVAEVAAILDEEQQQQRWAVTSEWVRTSFLPVLSNPDPNDERDRMMPE